MVSLSSSRTAGEGHTRREAGSQSHGTQDAGSAGLPRPALPFGRPRRGRANDVRGSPLCHSEGHAMLARIRKAREEGQGGFTLIELLVVMIIIGILAAIAIPVFLNQRKKAQDSAAKADVSTIGKEIATYFVDNAGVPTVDTASGRYTLTDNVVSPNTYGPVDLGKVSNNVTLTTGLKAGAAVAGVDSTHWCIGATNSQGDTKTFKYSAQNGLEKGACTSPAAP